MDVHVELTDKRAIEVCPEAKKKIQRVVNKERLLALKMNRWRKAEKRLLKAEKEVRLAKARVKKWKAKVAYYSKLFNK